MTPDTLLEAAPPAPANATPRSATPALQQRGVDLVRGVYAPAEVQALRTAMEAVFALPVEGARAPADCGRVLADVFQWPELAEALFTPAFFDALVALIGDGVVLLPEHAIHREGYGSWHKDTDMFERAGRMDHWAADFEVFQVAVYLQDNVPGHGGGLSVVEGSHRRPKPPATLVNPQARAAWYAAQPQTALDSRAGDAVVFHTRLDHCATPRGGLEPPHGAKLAFFCVVGREGPHTRAWSDFIHRRPDYTYLRGYRIAPALQARAQAHGCRFVG